MCRLTVILPPSSTCLGPHLAGCSSKAQPRQRTGGNASHVNVDTLVRRRAPRREVTRGRRPVHLLRLVSHLQCVSRFLESASSSGSGPAQARPTRTGHSPVTICPVTMPCLPQPCGGLIECRLSDRTTEGFLLPGPCCSRRDLLALPNGISWVGQPVEGTTASDRYR
jgi:hypothetical protein